MREQYIYDSTVMDDIICTDTGVKMLLVTLFIVALALCVMLYILLVTMIGFFLYINKQNNQTNVNEPAQHKEDEVCH